MGPGTWRERRSIKQTVKQSIFWEDYCHSLAFLREFPVWVWVMHNLMLKTRSGWGLPKMTKDENPEYFVTVFICDFFPRLFTYFNISQVCQGHSKRSALRNVEYDKQGNNKHNMRWKLKDQVNYSCFVLLSFISHINYTWFLPDAPFLSSFQLSHPQRFATSCSPGVILWWSERRWGKRLRSYGVATDGDIWLYLPTNCCALPLSFLILNIHSMCLDMLYFFLAWPLSLHSNTAYYHQPASVTLNFCCPLWLLCSSTERPFCSWTYKKVIKIN